MLEDGSEFFNSLLGIGLTIVQRLVSLHGGRISAHSDGPGCGTIFTLRLPAAHVANPRISPSDSRPNPDRRSLRMLVVDDNRDSAETMGLLQELQGHLTKVAYDGIHALTLAAEFQPDVILLDLGLPGLDGYEVAARLRAQPQHEKIFIVALTGYGSDEDRKRSKKVGFDEHLVKPMDTAMLNAMLEQHFSLDHLARKP